MDKSNTVKFPKATCKNIIKPYLGSKTSHGVQVIKENCRLKIWLLNANVYTKAKALYFYDHGPQNCVFYLLFYFGPDNNTLDNSGTFKCKCLWVHFHAYKFILQKNHKVQTSKALNSSQQDTTTVSSGKGIKALWAERNKEVCCVVVQVLSW